MRKNLLIFIFSNYAKVVWIIMKNNYKFILKFFKNGKFQLDNEIV